MYPEKSWDDEHTSNEPHEDSKVLLSDELDYLIILTYVSLGASVLGLLGTLYMILCSNAWRCNEKPVLRQISDNDFVLINLAVALVSFHLSYLGGLHSMTNDTSCLIGGLLVHFFWLASFVWEAAEGFLLFNTFVNAGKTLSRFRLKSFVACWGITVLIISASLLINCKAYIGDPPRCWLGPRYVAQFYGLFLAPRCVVLTGNFVVSFYVLKEIYHTTRTSELELRSTKKKEGLQTQLRRCLSLTVLLGIPWTLISLSEIFENDNQEGIIILVILCCGSHGLALFLVQFCSRRRPRKMQLVKTDTAKTICANP